MRRFTWVRKLRIEEIASVKVLYRNQFVEEEDEEDMKTRYAHLYDPNIIPNKGTNSL